MTPKNFNWAWHYYSEQEDQWIQFDCLDCMLLEFNYQAYIISSKSVYTKVEIMSGTIDIESMEMTYDLLVAKNSVRRLQTNDKKRPNAYRRHNPVDEDGRRASSINFRSK